MPAFPLHGWMPDGYRAMPIEVLAVFSGVLSKVAAYGFLRIVLPLFPHAAAHFQTLMLLIALASILYGSVMAFTQTDARLIAGYSSVAQLGFITLGIFALNPQGAQGALLQMVNHGLVVAPLFFIVGLLARARRRLGGHPRHGRHRLPRAGARDALPDRRAGDARDAGSRQLRRRVPDPARRLQSEARDRDHRLHRRRDGVACTCCGCSSARCTTASARGRLARDRARATALVLVPLVLVILALALYPQFGARSAPRRRRRRASAAAAHAVGAAPSSPQRGEADERAAVARAPPHAKAPHIDCAGLSPLIALLGGALLVLLVGLLARALGPRARRPAARARRARRATLGLTIWQWDEHDVARSRARCGSTT